MRRMRATFHIQTRRGAVRPVSVQHRDLDRLRLLGRWYALTARQVARYERGWATPFTVEDLDRDTNVVRKRLRLFEQIARESGGVGPPVTQLQDFDGTVRWSLTSYAEAWIEGTWAIRKAATAMYAAHAGAAFDVAMDLAPTVHAVGARLISEREMLTCVDENGDNLPDLASVWGGKRAEPDIVILAADGASRIIVEVERQQRGRQSNYERKVVAYADDPDVVAVWYVTDGPAATRRVERAVVEARQTHPHANVTVTPMVHADGFVQVRKTAGMVRDLTVLRDRRGALSA